jgi:hypothetical protein
MDGCFDEHGGRVSDGSSGGIVAADVGFHSCGRPRGVDQRGASAALGASRCEVGKGLA